MMTHNKASGSEGLSDEQIKRAVGASDEYWATSKLFIIGIARAIEDALAPSTPPLSEGAGVKGEAALQALDEVIPPHLRANRHGESFLGERYDILRSLILAASTPSGSEGAEPFDREYVRGYLEGVLEEATGNADLEVQKLLAWLAASSMNQNEKHGTGDAEQVQRHITDLLVAHRDLIEAQAANNRLAEVVAVERMARSRAAIVGVDVGRGGER